MRSSLFHTSTEAGQQHSLALLFQIIGNVLYVYERAENLLLFLTGSLVPINLFPGWLEAIAKTPANLSRYHRPSLCYATKPIINTGLDQWQPRLADRQYQPLPG